MWKMNEQIEKYELAAKTRQTDQQTYGWKINGE